MIRWEPRIRVTAIHRRVSTTEPGQVVLEIVGITTDGDDVTLETLVMNDAIDLSQLPVPSVIEELDYEVIVAEQLDDLVARYPSYDVPAESDPAYKILEVAAYARCWSGSASMRPPRRSCWPMPWRAISTISGRSSMSSA
nr:hypothetical protein [Halolamina pelagica]